MENEDHIWLLVARKLSGEATQIDLTMLDEALDRRPDIRHAVEITSRLYASGNDQGSDDNELYIAFAKHVQKMMETLKR